MENTPTAGPSSGLTFCDAAAYRRADVPQSART
jgi:hypothetical protein